MNMIERLSRAICRAEIEITDFTESEESKQRLVDELWCEWAVHVRAALDALMEPTMEMGLSGAGAVNKQMRGPGAPAAYDAAMDCFRAMIANAREGK